MHYSIPLPAQATLVLTGPLNVSVVDTAPSPFARPQAVPGLHPALVPQALGGGGAPYPQPQQLDQGVPGLTPEQLAQGVPSLTPEQIEQIIPMIPTPLAQGTPYPQPQQLDQGVPYQTPTPILQREPVSMEEAQAREAFQHALRYEMAGMPYEVPEAGSPDARKLRDAAVAAAKDTAKRLRDAAAVAEAERKQRNDEAAHDIAAKRDKPGI